MTAYRNAKSKFHKSTLVSNIVASIKERAENGIGGFVKKDQLTGRWYQVEDKIAREKVSHALRDAIKVQKRKEARQRKISDRLDTRVSSNMGGRLHTYTLGIQLALDNRIFAASQSDLSSPDNSPRSYSKEGLQPPHDPSDDYFFNAILATTFDSSDDDWEQSLKDCTERFLKSDDDWSCSTG